MTRSVAAAMADVAQAWLASLDDVQMTQGAWPYPSADERHRWFYTPTDHGGLPLARMRPAQQRLAMRLLATGLSRGGYVTAMTVMGLENVLDQVEGFESTWGRERGRDPQLYWLRVFGQPGEGPWSWASGGTTSRSTISSWTGRWRRARRASWARIPRRRRCSGPIRFARSAASRTSHATSCAHSTPSRRRAPC